jgi:hypothetical protein
VNIQKPKREKRKFGKGDHAYEKGDLDKALEAYRKAEIKDKVA